MALSTKFWEFLENWDCILSLCRFIKPWKWKIECFRRFPYL